MQVSFGETNCAIWLGINLFTIDISRFYFSRTEEHSFLLNLILNFR